MTIETDASKVSPQTHRFLGMYRPPWDKDARCPTCGFGRAEDCPGRWRAEHWDAGHYDVPQWEPLPTAEEVRDPVGSVVADQTLQHEAEGYRLFLEACKGMGFRFSWDAGKREREQLLDWLACAKCAVPFATVKDAEACMRDRRDLGTWCCRDAPPADPALFKAMEDARVAVRRFFAQNPAGDECELPLVVDGQIRETVTFRRRDVMGSNVVDSMEAMDAGAAPDWQRRYADLLRAVGWTKSVGEPRVEEALYVARTLATDARHADQFLGDLRGAGWEANRDGDAHAWLRDKLSLWPRLYALCGQLGASKLAPGSGWDVVSSFLRELKRQAEQYEQVVAALNETQVAPLPSHGHVLDAARKPYKRNLFELMAAVDPENRVDHSELGEVVALAQQLNNRDRVRFGDLEDGDEFEYMGKRRVKTEAMPGGRNSVDLWSGRMCFIGADTLVRRV